MAVIDGKNAVLGRLSAFTAKKLLAGEDVTIVNAEKVIITGSRDRILQKYIERRQRGSPQHGPFFPRQPDRIVRRAVRGMLPYKTNKGRTAFKKLRIYIGMPNTEAKAEKFIIKPVKSGYVTIGDVAKTLGWQE